MLFAAGLILEREPVRWADVPILLLMWLQNVGALCAVALFLAFLVRGRLQFSRLFAGASPALRGLATLCTVGSWVGLAGGYFILSTRGLQSWAETPAFVNLFRGAASNGSLVLSAAAALALVVVAYPVLRALACEMRFARIWAVARLSVKEAIRNRSVLVFGIIALVFLFADWFVPYKAEDQVRNYVRVLYWTLGPTYILWAAILGSFSMPNDIKNLTIHTVVTKPITKFEIVLGRFLGNALLLTCGLFFVGVLSLGYIWRGVTEQARRESQTARVIETGDLYFINSKGDSVGREWDYRRYIGGQSTAGAKKQYAQWLFRDLDTIRPNAEGKVRAECTFDIFRLTKGTENKGVLCTFVFADARIGWAETERFASEMRQKTSERIEAVRKEAGGKTVDLLEARKKIEADLLKEYPIHESSGIEVTDYETQSVEFPYALVERLREAHANQPAAPGGKAAMLQVLVSIDRDRGSLSQMLGVARNDLYLLADARSFYVNFMKGLVGMWLSVLLVLGMATAMSTYLSGVISLLLTLSLFLAGIFGPDIADLASGGASGGPLESFQRIVSHTPITAPLDASPGRTLAKGIDKAFLAWLGFFSKVIPDVGRYDLHAYVANGFDISWSRILFADNLLGFVGYLLPWAVAAFYFIRFREIANPT